MCNTLLSGALPNVHHPLTLNGFTHKLLPPLSCRDVGMGSHDAAENLATDLGDSQRCDRPDGMIHAVKNEQVKVAEISRNCEVHDLPAPIFEHAVVACPAAQNKIETAWGRSL